MGQASAAGDDDLGLEVVIEPDVVPRGTVDLRSLPTTPGPRGARPASPARDVDPTEGAVDAAIARDALARAKRAVAARTDSGALPTAPPPAAFPVDLPAPAASPALAAVEAAAEAPIPPRPAAAGGPSGRPPRPAPPPMGDPVADLGQASAGSAVAKLVAWLLFLVLCVLGLTLHVFGIAPWQGPAPAVATSVTGGDAAGATTATVVTPRPATEAPAAATEAPAAATEAPAAATEAAGPTPAEREAEALAALRAAAERAEVGADVGAAVEDAGAGDAGTAARAEALRAEAARHLERGALAEAAAALEALVALSPDDGEARFRLGRVRHRQGDLAAAEAAYRAAAERAPRDPRPLNNLGLVLQARGDAKGARATFERALAVAPEHPDVLSNLAALVEREAPAQAHPLYDKALTAAPTHGPARVGRARVRFALGDRDGAAADFAALVEQGGALAVRGLDGLGLVARDAGKAAEAEACFRRALERSPEDAAARTNLGVALTDQGKLADAVRELEAATKASPRSARAWQALGVARSRLAQEDPQLLYAAKEAYEQAIKLDEGDWATHYDYGLCAEQFGNFLFAMREYERASTLRPQAWQPVANLARLYERGNNRAKAIEVLERGLRAEPRAGELHYALAVLLAKEKRDGEARAALRRFVELTAQDDPRLPAARQGL